MRIEYSVDGGLAAFPGLARPTPIDVDALAADDASRLRELLERSRFFDRPEPAAASLASGAADQRRSIITIDDGGRRRTLTVPDASGDADLDALVELLRRLRRGVRAR